MCVCACRPQCEEADGPRRSEAKCPGDVTFNVICFKHREGLGSFPFPTSWSSSDYFSTEVALLHGQPQCVCVCVCVCRPQCEEADGPRRSVTFNGICFKHREGLGSFPFPTSWSSSDYFSTPHKLHINLSFILILTLPIHASGKTTAWL